ncbi:MAG: hypothetical protein LBV60_16565 [Streptomyces sp.]|nr:hypothetical protein [Streptomyces sp.]
MQSHADLWLRPLAANGPEDHNGNLAAAFRAGYEWLTAHREPTGVAVALEHAARIAEAVTAGTLSPAEGTGRSVEDDRPHTGRQGRERGVCLVRPQCCPDHRHRSPGRRSSAPRDLRPVGAGT